MTEEKREAVLALVAMEMPVDKIMSALSLSRDSVLRVCDPEYAEVQRAQVRKAGRVRNERLTEEKLRRGHCDFYRSRVDQDAARLAREIPSDERDLTGRLCGDPLPGRSALDQREGRA